MGTGDSRKKFTVSVWVKRGKIPSGDQNHIWNYHANPNVCALGFNGNKLRFYHYDSGGTFNAQYVSSAVFRDTSAWYHIVASVDTTLSSATDRVKLWVNGTRITSFDTQTTFSQNYDTHVGVNNYTALIGIYADGSSFKFGGYVANKYFLDGITASETDFGRYQEDGVWVPKNYSGSYGTNGYNLDFADSSDLGNDVSGNNNDFTASGFDSVAIGSYAGTIFTDHVNTGASATPNISSTASTFTNAFTNVFDGDTTTRIYTSGAGTWIIFRPSTAIPMSTGLRIWAEGAYVNQVWLNGSNTSFTTTGTTTWQTIPIGSETQITSIAIQGTPSPPAGATLFAIEVDGTILRHNTDNDVDYFDTPTSNYPTINSLYPSTDPPEQDNTIEAGLGYTGKANRFGTGATTMALPSSGEYYWEHEVVTHADHQYFGVTRMPSVASGSTTGFISFRAYDGANWYVYQDSTLLTTGSFQITDGDIIGQAYNVDTGVYRVYINGTLAATNTWTLRPTDEELFVYGSLEAKNSNKFRVNYGQRDFIYTPPTGAKRLQTNNLPEPTIKKGNQHFGVLTYAAPGSPSFPITINGSGGNNGTGELDFDQSPDLVWIKMRNGSQNHIIFDTVRGKTKSLRADDNISEVTTRSNFDFATNGFTFSAQDAETYQQNDSYVAWCWKAGGTAVSNTDGTITSSVSANTDAGFSIVSYTGTGANATVGHGLTEPPNFAIFKNRDNGSNWAVGSDAIDSWGTALYLNLDSAKETTGGPFFNNGTNPTASVINLGSSANTNGNGNDMIAYCWHSVEGFSKFGSYTGNASGTSPNADGPFVHLGFKPAFILVKRTDSSFGGEWSIHDTTRSPQNPNRLVIAADLPNNEITQGGIDFLSNGFKIRDGAGWTNQSGGSYIYAAFAESPFGGENAPPATAR